MVEGAQVESGRRRGVLAKETRWCEEAPERLGSGMCVISCQVCAAGQIYDKVKSVHCVW